MRIDSSKLYLKAACKFARYFPCALLFGSLDEESLAKSVQPHHKMELMPMRKFPMIAKRTSFLLAIAMLFPFCNQTTFAQSQTASSASVKADRYILESIKLWKNRPIEAHFHQRVELFGEKLTGGGRYMQLGRGSKKARLEIGLSTEGDEFKTKLTQINDGRMLYLQTQLNESNSIKGIDLERLGEMNLVKSGMPNESQWMAMGGLSHLLMQFVSEFDLTNASEEQFNDLRTFRIEGIWKTDKLKALVGPKAVSSSGAVNFEKIPPQLPGKIAISFVAEGANQMFPIKVEFFGWHSGSLRSVNVLTFTKIRTDGKIDQKFFQLEENSTKVQDITTALIQRAEIKTR